MPGIKGHMNLRRLVHTLSEWDKLEYILEAILLNFVKQNIILRPQYISRLHNWPWTSGKLKLCCYFLRNGLSFFLSLVWAAVPLKWTPEDVTGITHHIVLCICPLLGYYPVWKKEQEFKQSIDQKENTRDGARNMNFILKVI